MVGENQPHSSASRRTILRRAAQTGAVGSLGAIAGCSGNSGNTQNGSQGNDQNGTQQAKNEADPGSAAKEMSDRHLNIAEWTPPNTISLNYFAPGFAGEYATVVSPQLAQFSSTHGEWMGLSAKNWTLDEKNDEFRVQIRDGQFWDDGQPVKAKDWAIFFELNRRMVPESARSDQPIIRDWAADGDNTLVAKLNGKTGYNTPAVTSELFGPAQTLAPGMRVGGFFHDKLKGLRSATSKSERDSIRTTVTNHTMALPDVQTAGPYRPTKADASRAVFKTEPDHAIAKLNNINWSGVTIKFLGSRSVGKITSALKNNKIDISNGGIPPSIDIPDNVVDVINPEAGGISMTLNYGVTATGKKTSNDPLMDILKDVRVRRAMMYAINRKVVAQSAMKNIQQPVKLPSGLQAGQVKRNFPDLYPKLDRYKTNQKNLKKAEKLMRQAGCTKQNGNWMHKGKQLQFELITIPTSEWVGAGRAISSMLSNFGIQVKFSVLNSTQKGARMESNRFQIALDSWGYGVPALFMAYLRYNPRNENWVHKLTVEAPKEVGNWDAPLKEWKPYKMLDSMRRKSLSKTHETVKKLVWVTNYAQPYFCLLNDGSGMMMNTDTFEWGPLPPKQQGSQIRLANSDDPKIYGFEQETGPVKRGHWGKYEMQAEPKPDND